MGASHKFTSYVQSRSVCFVFDTTPCLCCSLRFFKKTSSPPRPVHARLWPPTNGSVARTATQFLSHSRFVVYTLMWNKPDCGWRDTIVTTSPPLLEPRTIDQHVMHCSFKLKTSPEANNHVRLRHEKHNSKRINNGSLLINYLPPCRTALSVTSSPSPRTTLYPCTPLYPAAGRRSLSRPNHHHVPRREEDVAGEDASRQPQARAAVLGDEGGATGRRRETAGVRQEHKETERRQRPIGRLGGQVRRELRADTAVVNEHVLLGARENCLKIGWMRIRNLREDELK